MRIVELYVGYEAYYSGAEYDEYVYLLESDYNKLGINLDDEEVYLGELDGEHSECVGEILVTFIDEREQENYNYNIHKSDGDCLFQKICDYENYEVVGDMIHRANSYINKLDCYQTLEVTLKKSDITKVVEFIEQLKN